MQKTADFLPWNENKRVINNLYKDGDYQYCLLFIVGTYVGLRISDLRCITWDDLLNKDRLVLTEKKRDKRRSIVLDQNLKDDVLDLYGKEKPRSKYIITVKHTDTINQKLKRLKDRYDIQIDSFTTHTFRKTFGRHYAELRDFSEKSLLWLMEAFNHSSIKQTKTYIGIKQEEIDDVYLSISERFLG